MISGGCLRAKKIQMKVLFMFSRACTASIAHCQTLSGALSLLVYDCLLKSQRLRLLSHLLMSCTTLGLTRRRGEPRRLLVPTPKLDSAPPHVLLQQKTPPAPAAAPDTELHLSVTGRSLGSPPTTREGKRRGAQLSLLPRDAHSRLPEARGRFLACGFCRRPSTTQNSNICSAHSLFLRSGTRSTRHSTEQCS